MSLLTATRSELTKQFTTSIWWILTLVLAVYVGLVAAGLAFALAAVATGALTGGDVPPLPAAALPPVVYSVATSIGYVFPLLVGTLMATSEFRHQTLTPTFLATPRRGLVLGAKVVVAIVFGAILGAVGIAVTVGPGAAILAASGVDSTLGSAGTWALIGRMLLAFALWTIVGLGVGTLVRNQVTAIVLVLAFTQFIEPIARFAGTFVTWLDPIARVLPGAAGDALVGASIFSIGATGGGGAPLEWWTGGLALLAYAIAFLALGAATSWRRDVS